MLTNLTGEKKVQFYQEKRWQTGNTPHCMKCAYQSKMQLHSSWHGIYHLKIYHLSYFHIMLYKLLILANAVCMSHMNFILAWLVLLSEGNANFFYSFVSSKTMLTFRRWFEMVANLVILISLILPSAPIRHHYKPHMFFTLKHKNFTEKLIRTTNHKRRNRTQKGA